MAFPKRYAEMAARARVPAGFAIVALFLFLAQPNKPSLVAGGLIAAAGLALRAWAAGHLVKYEGLSTSGPFAHVRNPLYMGTLIAGAGFAVAGARLDVGVLLVGFFLLLYLPVIEEEESYLRGKFAAYAEYMERVPRLWPTWRPRASSSQVFRLELYRRNQEYRALAAYLIVMGLLTVKSFYG
jgi:protein-S-isoprenylcysteine O-methyltransferase Ste14